MGASVLVAGAGPVGIGTALLLARWGVPSILLEAKPERDQVGSKAICMQRDVLDVLDRIDCAEAMLAEGSTWWVSRTYYRDHELFTTTFPDSGRSTLPPWINISQCSTESYLYRRLDGEPLVDVRYGHQVTAVREEDAGVAIDAEGPRGGVTLAGTHLVAADGGHSAIRRLLGIGFPGRSFDDQFLIADIRAELPFPNERRFYFDPPWNPGRQVLVHEQPDRVWRIDWQVPADYDLERERATGELDARIRRVTGDVPYEVVWLSVYRFQERCADALRGGRVFLAGDAAHVYAPFGARGLNSGVQDAENLAWKLAFVRHGWVTGEAAETLLDSYDVERRAAAAENLRVTDATMRFLVPQTEEQWSWRREVLRRAVTEPAARKLIDSGKLAEPYWYLESPLTTSAGRVEAFPTEPGVPRPPVAGVLCPDGPCEVAGRPEVGRLRNLFGGGFVVVVADRGRLRQALAACVDAVAAPSRMYALPDIDTEGVLARALDATADSVHVVRPDGHLAAVLPAFDADGLADALRRACGSPTCARVRAP